MSNKSTLTFISCFAVALTACDADEKPVDPVPDPDPDPIVDVAPEYQQICENHLSSLQGSSADPTRIYLMQLDRSSGVIRLKNGGFEGADAMLTDLDIISDPNYVYSGESSVRISGSGFNANITEDEHFSERDLVSIKFWLYSAYDETIDYEIEAFGMMLDRINRSDGVGYSGHSQASSRTITVEPHSWVEVNLDFEDYHQCLSALSINTFTDGAVFYVDDIEIEAETTEDN